MNPSQPTPQATQQQTPVSSPSAPKLQQTVTYYTGLTVVSGKSCIIQLSADNHFRAYLQNAASGQYSDLTLDITPVQSEIVTMQLTQLVIKSAGKTYRFEFQGLRTTAEIASDSVVGLAMLNKDLQNNPVSPWITALTDSGYPVTADKVDDVTQSLFRNYRKIVLWILIPPTVLVVIALILSLIFGGVSNSPAP